MMLFKFHFGHGATVSLWADDMKEAIGRFREFAGPETVFVTDVDMQRRKNSVAVSEGL